MRVAVYGCWAAFVICNRKCTKVHDNSEKVLKNETLSKMMVKNDTVSQKRRHQNLDHIFTK